MRVIDFPNAPEWVQDVQLDGVTQRIRGRWNYITRTWSIDLLSRNGSVIVAGIRLTYGVALLSQFKDPRLPAGDLVIYDTSAPQGNFDDFFAGRTVLAYINEDDVAALIGD